MRFGFSDRRTGKRMEHDGWAALGSWLLFGLAFWSALVAITFASVVAWRLITYPALWAASLIIGN